MYFRVISIRCVGRLTGIDSKAKSKKSKANSISFRAHQHIWMRKMWWAALSRWTESTRNTFFTVSHVCGLSQNVRHKLGAAHASANAQRIYKRKRNWIVDLLILLICRLPFPQGFRHLGWEQSIALKTNANRFAFLFHGLALNLNRCFRWAAIQCANMRQGALEHNRWGHFIDHSYDFLELNSWLISILS